MKENIFKSISLLIASLLIFLVKSDNSKGCSFNPPDYDEYYNIFDPRIINTPLKPFFFSESLYYSQNEIDEERANITEWQNYFNNIPNYDDVNNIIYHSTKEELIKYYNYILSGKENIPYYMQNNSLLNYLKEKSDTTFFHYLQFTKECEQNVKKPEDYWNKLVRDTIMMKEDVKKGLKEYYKAKDNYLKIRYAFQVIRLNHYLGNYNEVISLYDKLIKGINDKSILKYWALSHVAGCLYSLGKKAESLSLFTKVFYECPSRRSIVMENFKLANDSLFYKTLLLCKENKYKAAAWFIYSYPGLEAEGIKRIYDIDPYSDYIDVLLSRIINKYEKEIQQANSLFRDSLNIQEKNEAGEILNLISQYSDQKQLKRRNVWFAAKGYIYALLRNKDSADTYLKEALRLTKPDEKRFQLNLKILQIVSKIINIKNLDALTENSILSDLNWFEKNKVEPNWSDTTSINDSFSFIKKILIFRYSAQNEVVKEHLLSEIDLRSNPDLNASMELYSFMKKNNLSDYEKYLVKKYQYNTDQVGSIIGTNYISKHDFPNAIKFLKSLSVQDTLLADPFTVRIKDCADCDASLKKNRLYSKLDFAKKMLLYKKLADAKNLNSAKYYYLLANGYYNISYYGNSWNAASFSWTVYAPYLGKYDDYGFLDCSTAQEYYVKAMNAAQDREFAAKCCFMASKCEQNKFYNENWNDSLYYYDWTIKDKYIAYVKQLKNKYRNYFRLLKNGYSDTKFYHEAIEECKYFNEFVKNN